MISVGGTMNGRPLLVLGLSRATWKKLMRRQEIHFDTVHLPELPPMSVVLIAGETDTDISAEIFAHFPTINEVS